MASTALPMNLASLKAAVADANQALHRSGLVTLSFGNVSAVDRAAGVLAIKPSGVPYNSLRAEDIVIVAIEDGRIVDGSLRPSVDTPTHRYLYMELPDIGAVIHTHSPHASAWAQALRPIPALGTTHADFFRGPVPVTRRLRPAEIESDYEWETGAVIVETLRARGRTSEDCPGVIVASHGPFVWGSTIGTALANAIALEAIAGMATETLLLDPGVGEVSAALLARHHERKHGPESAYGQASEAANDAAPNAANDAANDAPQPRR